MARPVWTGTVSFGLVNVPVKAHTAVRDHDVHFHQLREEDRRRASATARCPRSRVGRSTATTSRWASRSARAATSRSTRTSCRTSVRPRRRPSRSPISSPSTRSTRSTTSAPTGWSRTATRPRRRTSCCWRRWRNVSGSAIGTVVMRNKQYLTAIRPLDGALAMSTMRFADEVVPRADVEDMPRRRQARHQDDEDGDAAARCPGQRLGPASLPGHLHRGAATPHRGQGRRARRSSRSRRMSLPRRRSST